MKQIEEFPRYYASEDGTIWDSKRKRFIPQYKRSKSRSYLCATLEKDGSFKLVSIHRLIASTFIPNPLRLPEVNHKDENPQNNCVENLEWCDRTYNNNYGSRNKRSGMSQQNRIDCSKVVLQFDIDGNFIAEYPSAAEASRRTNVDHSKIVGVCNHKKYCHTAGGYIWKWR